MKEYYTERNQLLTPLDLSDLRNYFLRIYKQFFYEGYFAEERFDWAVIDPDLYLYQKLGIKNIWPFGKKIETYDEATLFSIVEFLYGYVYYNLPYERYYPSLEDGQKEYRNMVNDALRFYDGGYELTEKGEIQKLSPLGFKSLTTETVETNDPNNIDSRVKYAISKFSRYNSSVEDKKDAVRTLGEVLEYLRESFKKDGTYLFTDDDNNLREIMNRYNIRHNNRSQRSDYDKDIWYDWVFYISLASVNVVLKLNERELSLKIKHTD